MKRPIHHRLTTAVRACPLYVITLLLLWLCLVLPAAFLNQLFPLDYAGVLGIVRDFPSWRHWILSPYNGSGRYVPVYWLYHSLLYVFWSVNIKAYYIVQSAIFLLSALFTAALFQRVTGHRLLTAVFASLVILSSPNAETLYTLFKNEPLVYLCISAILLWLYSNGPGRGSLGVAHGAAIAVLLAMALWAKETAIAFGAFGAAAFLSAWLLRRLRAIAPTPDVPHYAKVLLAICVGVLLSKLPYLVFFHERANAGAHYTSYPITANLVLNNAKFYVFQQPDVIGFGIAGALLVALIVRRVIQLPEEESGRSISDLIFVIGLLAMAWAYVGIFLIWRWPMGYYLMIPAIVFRFVVCYALYIVAQRSLIRSTAARVCGYALASLIVYAGAYMWYVATTQLSASRVYTMALQKFIGLTHEGDRLVMESYPFFAEHVTGTEQLIKIAFGTKRPITGIADLVNPAVITKDLMDLREVAEADLRANEANFPRQGDYVFAITANKLATWQVRGVAPFYSTGSELHADGAYVMREVAEDQIHYAGPFVNIWTGWPDFRDTYMGYKLYQVTAGPRFTWLGRYPDGWIQKQARLTLYPEYVSRALVHVGTSKYTPSNAIHVFEGDTLVASAMLSDGREHTFSLVCKAAVTKYRFEVERAFVPKTVGMNNDARELGAFVRLEPFGHQVVTRK